MPDLLEQIGLRILRRRYLYSTGLRVIAENYHPNQPRDSRGRFGSGGGDGGGKRGDQLEVMNPDLFWEELPPALDKNRKQVEGMVGKNPEIRSTIEVYTSDGYEVFNAQLREGKPDPKKVKEVASAFHISESEMQGMVDEGIPALDKITSLDLDKPITTYRGVDEHTTNEILKAAKKGKGVTISDEAFQSTSINPEVAATFAARGGSNVIMEITAKRGAYLETISYTPGDGEFLLPRNSKLRIDSVHEGVKMKIPEGVDVENPNAPWFKKDITVIRATQVPGKKKEVVPKKKKYKTVKKRSTKNVERKDTRHKRFVIDYFILEEGVENYNPNQPRDARGRFGSGGGGGGGSMSPMNHKRMRRWTKEDYEQYPGWDGSTGHEASYGGAIFNDEGKILLREPSHHFDGYVWTLPKGRCNGPDDNPVDTALREVAEETGHKGQITGLVPGRFEGGTSHMNLFVMQSRGYNSKLRDKETHSTKWATYEEAIDLVGKTKNPIGRRRDLQAVHAAFKARDSLVKNYHPNQPRDSRGRFGSGGSGGGGGLASIDVDKPEPINATLLHGGTDKEGDLVTYYTDDRSVAESYVQMSNDRFGEGGAVHEKQVSIKSPAPREEVLKEANRIGIDVESDGYTPASVFDTELYDRTDVKRLVAGLRDKGYDGAVLQDVPYGGEGSPVNVAIAFSGKVKSKYDLPPWLRNVRNWHPSQPRDYRGRFGSGGGAGAGFVLPNPNEVEFVKNLPGSTHPKLVRDKDGKLWVMKEALTAEKVKRLENEIDADNAYRALGVDVPPSGVVLNPERSDRAHKFSEYIDGGQTLDDWKHGKDKAQIQEMHDKIGEHFVADATLANWDVIGLENDNILIKDGKPYRIDNGGALLYRAQGAPKGSKFSDQVIELDTLRDKGKNYSSGTVFGNLPPDKINQQIVDISKKRAAVLEAVSNPKTREKLKARFNDLKSKAKVIKKELAPKVKGKITKQPTSGKPIKSSGAKKKVTAATKEKATGEGVVSGAAFGTAVGVASYLQQNKGNSNFTKVQLAKVQVYNPNGISDGVLNVPKAMMANPANLKHLQKILPAGTVIKLSGKKTSKSKLPSAVAKRYGITVDYSTIQSGTKSAKAKAAKKSKTLPSHFVQGVHTGGYYSTPNKSGKVIGGSQAEVKFKHSLTYDEKHAIGSWKGSARSIRKNYVEAKKGKATMSPKTKNIVSAIEKAPAHEGIAYRGIHSSGGPKHKDYAHKQMAAIEKAGIGGTWVDDAPTGFSKNAQTGASFSHGDLLLKVKTRGKNMRSIANVENFGGEAEMLARPGTKFRIVGIQKDVTVKIQGAGHKKKHVKMLVEMEET